MLYVALLRPAVVGIDKLGCGEGPSESMSNLLKYVCISWCKLLYSLLLRSFPPPVFDRLQYANMEGEVLGDLVTCNDGRQTHRGQCPTKNLKALMPRCTPTSWIFMTWETIHFIVCIMHLKATLNIWCGWGSIAKHYCFSCNRAAHLSPTHTRKKSYYVPHE